MTVLYRIAQLADIPALEELIPLSARTLQAAHYTPQQLDAAIGTVFGVDAQLIRDGTYFVAISDERIVGCGGWSKRQTQFGADKERQGEDPLRDPSKDAAMIRAFFVHPDYSRRGIGRELMNLSERAALAAGFTRIDIAATLPGIPLYEACGYHVTERFETPLRGGGTLSLARMSK